MKQATIFSALALLGILAVGCATPSMSANTYSRSQAGQVQTVHDGEVIMVREVQIEGVQTGLGGIGGGAMGYTLGKSIGGGRGQDIAKVAGAIGGVAAGSRIEEAATRKQGLEITVKLDNGEVISVVQEADELINEGDLVRVLRRPDGSARVIQ